MLRTPPDRRRLAGTCVTSGTFLLFLSTSLTTPAPAQNYQVPGFRSYTPGFSGRTNSTNYNGGFSGLNPNTQQMPAQPNYTQPQRSQMQQSPQSTMESLENALDAVDTNWNRTPVSGPPVQQQQYARPSVPSQQMQYAQQPAGGGKRPGLFPGVSKQEMLRIFFEGGTPQTGGGGSYGAPSVPPPRDLSGKTSTAYSNYQTAQNEAQKSLYEANKARYDKDKWNRKNAATAAEYAANNANYAAQRAESAAYGGDSKAQSYANLARQAANRARNNANQARYNADTIQ